MEYDAARGGLDPAAQEGRVMPVFVYGDWIYDVFVDVQYVKPCPEHPVVPAVREIRRYVQCGGAANVALNCLTLRTSSFLDVDIAAPDNSTSWSETLARELARHRAHSLQFINTRPIPGDAMATRTRYYCGSQLLLRMDRDADAEALAQRLAETWDRCALRQNLTFFAQRPMLSVLVSYRQGAFGYAPMVRDMLYLLRQHPQSVVLYDPGTDVDVASLANEGMLSQVVLKANWNQWRELWKRAAMSDHWPYDEAAAANVTHALATRQAGSEIREEAIRVAAHAAARLRDCQAGLWLTVGHAGSVVFVPGSEQPVEIAASSCEVADPCGAGDVLLAGTAVRLAEIQEQSSELDREAWRHAVRFGTQAATVATLYRGSRAISLAEVIHGAPLSSCEEFRQTVGRESRGLPADSPVV